MCEEVPLTNKDLESVKKDIMRHVAVASTTLLQLKHGQFHQECGPCHVIVSSLPVLLYSPRLYDNLDGSRKEF